MWNPRAAAQFFEILIDLAASAEIVPFGNIHRSLESSLGGCLYLDLPFTAGDIALLVIL